MIKNLSLLLGIIILFASSACASDVEKHKQEAKDLCEVYNPDNWAGFFDKNPSVSEIYREIGSRIKKIVTTDQFRAIYQEIHDEYKPDVYNFTKTRVGKLIGEEWKCEYYDNFYFPRKEIILNIDEVDKVINPLLKRIEIIISVDKDGAVYINSDKPTPSDKQSLKDSILSQPNAKKANIVIYSDAIAPNQVFVTIVTALKELGFETVSIATQ